MSNALCNCVCTYRYVFYCSAQTAHRLILFTIYIGRHFVYLVLFTF